MVLDFKLGDIGLDELGLDVERYQVPEQGCFLRLGLQVKFELRFGPGLLRDEVLKVYCVLDELLQTALGCPALLLNGVGRLVDVGEQLPDLLEAV